MNKPHETPPSEFVSAVSNAAVEGSSNFVVQLSLNGSPLGYMGVNDSGWCIQVNDQAAAVQFQTYVHGGVTYYKVASGTYAGKYLSVSKNAYVGLYSWSGATGWSLTNQHLISSYNNQPLSIYSTDNQYLYAWEAYQVLTVQLT